MRPENIYSRSAHREATDNFYETEVYVVENMGNDMFVYFSPGNNQYIARLDLGVRVQSGEAHEMWFDTASCHLFEKETGKNIVYPPKFK